MFERLKEMQIFLFKREQLVTKIYNFLINNIDINCVECIENTPYTVILHLSKVVNLPIYNFMYMKSHNTFECDSISVTCNVEFNSQVIETILIRNNELLHDTVSKHDPSETTTYNALMTYINSVTNYQN